MSIRTGSIQERIDYLVEEKINTAETEIKLDTERIKKNMKNGIIPTDGQVCEQQIRNLRKNALESYSNIKFWFDANILGIINEHSQINAMQTLYERNDEFTAIDAKRKKAEEEIESISEYDKKLSRYDRFLLYGGYSRKNKNPQSNNTKRAVPILRDNSITDAVVQTYKSYISKKWLYIFIGIIVTILCTVADFNIIYSVFLYANMTDEVSITAAIITSLILDLPPYILGLILSIRNDRRRIWYFINDSNDPGSTNEMKIYKLAIAILRAAIMLLFSAYLIMRILLFFGGGDFDAIMHSILSRKLDFDSFTFSSADLISTFVPFGTSAVSFAIGLMLSTSYTDYVKTAVIVIDKELDNRIKKYREIIIDCEQKIDGLKQEITGLKQSIWTFYIGVDSMLPIDDDTFIAKITDAYMRLNFPLYKQVYQSTAFLLRSNANKTLEYINSELAPYSSNQMAVTSMKLSDEERSVLDSIWVLEDGKKQCSATETTLSKIDEHIELFQQMLKN